MSINGTDPRRCGRQSWSAILFAFAAGAAIGGSATPLHAQEPARIPGYIVRASPSTELATAIINSQADAPPAARRVASRVVARRAGRAHRADLPLDARDSLLLTSTAALTTGLSFPAATVADTGAFPPDASGAIGPSQFLLASNGRIRTFARNSGASDGVLNATTDTFFLAVRAGALTFGPRVRFDRQAQRWFITIATDSAPARILVASSNEAIIGPGTVWSFSSFAAAFPGQTCVVDSPTLGIDASALYIGVNQFCGAGTPYSGTSAFVIRKSSAFAGSSLVVTAFHNLTGSPAGGGPFAPHGVDNDDPAATAGYFLAVDNAVFGRLVLRRVNDPGGQPTISADIPVTVASTAAPVRVPHAGNLAGTTGELDGGDDRIASARINDGRLWAAQTIGVNQEGAASSAPSRNAIRWYELQSLGTSPTLAQSGTIFDPAAAPAARSYWVPSIATSPDGRTVVGFSAAGPQEFVNAGLTQRRASDPAGAMESPGLVTASSAGYNPAGDPGSAAQGRRWGGYGESTVDPCDRRSIWSIHQFVDATDSYGLQVTRSLGPAPGAATAVSPSSIAGGQASVNVTITASGLFDGGAGQACRMAASVPGVTVNSVTFHSPTSVTLNLSTINTPSGARTVTLINPDGQSSTSAPLLTIAGGPVMQIEWPRGGQAGQPLYVAGWAVDGSGTTGTGVSTVHVYAYPAAGGSIFLGAATYGEPRADIAAQFGSRFRNSGFSLRASSPLPAGPATIVAYAYSTVASAFNNSLSVNAVLAPPTPPVGVIDTPADNVLAAGELGITGWAVDDGGVSHVEIFRSRPGGGPSEVFIGRATLVPGARPDVEAAYPSVPGNHSAGWGYMLLTNMLPNRGNGTFTVYAYAVDYGGLRTEIGSRRVRAANNQSQIPFGSIDTPAQGATVSGVIPNFGWALTPLPGAIAEDGSTIDVYVDNVFAGHPVYNQYRPDIATAFPGLANSNGAVGYFMLDTTLLADGLHTIAWVIRDNRGGTSGVGSRFFTVRNGS